MADVVTVKRLGGDKVHLHQAVCRPRGDYRDHYVVVGFTDSGVKLHDPDFDGVPFTLTDSEWQARGYTPRTTTDGVPIFAY